MSWRNIGNLLGSGSNRLWETPSFNGNVKPNNLRSSPPVSDYHGGTLSVTIAPADSQRDVMNRGLLAHAKKAGLSDQASVPGDKSPAQMFADFWTTDKLRHRKSGAEYTEAEFLELKKNKTTTFTLSEAKDADVLADLNSRIEAFKETDVIKVDTNIELTLAERAAALMAKAGANGASSSAITSKPVATPGSVDAAGGKVRNAADALTEHIKQNYNPHNRVWGDKINQVLSQAKQDGIGVDNFELATDENGKERANFTISAENKAKLDKLFAQALSETKKGEWASDEGQREGTRMALDIPITLVNSVTKAIEGLGNIPSTLEDLARATRQPGSWATAKIGGIPEVDAQIPKIPDPAPLGEKIMPQVDLSPFEIPNQSDLFNKDATGKVNPNGQTLGKTAATVTSLAIPIPVGQTAEVVVDAVAQGGTRIAQKIGKIGQETSEGMRSFGQLELATANGASVGKTSGAIDRIPGQAADDLNSKIVTVDSNGNPSGTRFRSDYEDLFPNENLAGLRKEMALTAHTI